MAGFKLALSGDYATIQKTVAEALQAQGFQTEVTGEWTARAERGSKGGSIVFGAFTGKSGRHIIIDIAFSTEGDGNVAVTLTEGTSGMSGGLIGMKQAKDSYREVYDTLSNTFKAAGVYVSGGKI